MRLMTAREALERMTWAKFEALLAQWEARLALLRHNNATPPRYAIAGWVAWREERTRLALELSKAEARLIELEASNG